MSSESEVCVEDIPQGTIRGVAWDHHIRGHYCLDYDDLVAEGYALAIKLMQKVQKKDFDRMFRKSLKNHFLKMIRAAFTAKRNTILVDLTEVLTLVDKERIEEMWMEHKLAAVRDMLSPEAQKLLGELINPSEATISLAVKMHRRQNRKYKRGEHSVKRSLRITDKMIQKTLGFTPGTFVFYELEIRKAIRQVV